MLWSIDRTADRVAPIAATGGAQPPVQRASGDALAWAANERVAMRIEPPPIWSNATQVFALPLEVADGALLLSLELNDVVPLQPAQFEGAALYVAAVMSVQLQMSALAQEHLRADELIRTLRELPSAMDADSLSVQLACAASRMIGADGAALSVVERESGVVIAVDGEGTLQGLTFTATESATALAMRARATLVKQPGTLGGLAVIHPMERFPQKPSALVAVPLMVAGDVMGMITAWSRGEIAEHAVQDLETLAPYAALQLRHAREFGAMRTRAEHDALTGLNNRRAFEEHFGSEAARYSRYNRPFALLIFDIDHFKTVNDRFGHEAGDYVLREVASVIQKSLRNVDFAARLGGEEFVVLLPETGLEKAIEIAERVRTRMEALIPSWRGQDIPVRISAGVSSVPECVATPDALLRSADTALYASKNAGRNRVTSAERPKGRPRS